MPLSWGFICSFMSKVFGLKKILKLMLISVIKSQK